MQMYAAPSSDGTPLLKPSKESLVINEPFVVVVTNSKISDALEMPLVVCNVKRS